MEQEPTVLPPVTLFNAEVSLFFHLLVNNGLLKKLMVNQQLNDEDLKGLTYLMLRPNEIFISRFILSVEEVFSAVTILITRFGIMLEFITQDNKYFDDSGLYFNTFTSGRPSISYHQDQRTYSSKCKRIKRVTLLGRQVDCCVFKSEKFGSKIMIWVI